jgi:hypothetical protein
MKRIYFSVIAVVVVGVFVAIFHKLYINKQMQRSVFSQRTGVILPEGMRILKYKEITGGFDSTVAWQLYGTDEQLKRIVDQYGFLICVDSNIGQRLGECFNANTNMSDYPFAWTRQMKEHVGQTITKDNSGNIIYFVMGTY